MANALAFYAEALPALISDPTLDADRYVTGSAVENDDSRNDTRIRDCALRSGGDVRENRTDQAATSLRIQGRCPEAGTSSVA